MTVVSFNSTVPVNVFLKKPYNCDILRLLHLARLGFPLKSNKIIDDNLILKN